MDDEELSDFEALLLRVLLGDAEGRSATELAAEVRFTDERPPGADAKQRGH